MSLSSTAGQSSTAAGAYMVTVTATGGSMVQAEPSNLRSSNFVHAPGTGSGSDEALFLSAQGESASADDSMAAHLIVLRRHGHLRLFPLCHLH